MRWEYSASRVRYQSTKLNYGCLFIQTQQAWKCLTISHIGHYTLIPSHDPKSLIFYVAICLQKLENRLLKFHSQCSAKFMFGKARTNWGNFVDFSFWSCWTWRKCDLQKFIRVWIAHSEEHIMTFSLDICCWHRHTTRWIGPGYLVFRGIPHRLDTGRFTRYRQVTERRCDNIENTRW